MEGKVEDKRIKESNQEIIKIFDVELEKKDQTDYLSNIFILL